MATSGTTGAEGESIGNSWKFSHLADAFSTQWCDAALAARDSKARKLEAAEAAVDNFDLSGLSEAASRIEHAMSWNDSDQHVDEYGDDDDESLKTMLIDTLAIVMTNWIGRISIHSGYFDI